MKEIFTKRILAALEAKKISPVMAVSCLAINEQADESGIWQGNATKLYTMLGGQIALVNVQKMLKKLYDKKFLRSMRKKGQSTEYPVAVVPAPAETTAVTPSVTPAKIVPVITPEIPAETIAHDSPTEAEDVINSAPGFVGQAVVDMLTTSTPEQKAKFGQLVAKHGDVPVSKALVAFAETNTNIESFLKDIILWLGVSGE